MRTPRCTECGSSDVSFETDDGEWPGEDFFFCNGCSATFKPDTNMTRDEFRGHMKSSGYMTTEAARKTLKKPGKKSSGSGPDFSHLNIHELEDMLNAVQSAIRTKQKTNIRPQSGLKTIDDHEEMLSDMMTGERVNEDDFVESLLDLSGSEVYDLESGGKEASEISKILGVVAQAAQEREELEDYDDDGAVEAQRSYDDHYALAMTLLKKFWVRYVEGKQKKKNFKR